MLNIENPNATGVQSSSIYDAFLFICESAGVLEAYNFINQVESFGGVKRCWVRREKNQTFRIRLFGDNWKITSAGDSIERIFYRAKKRAGRYLREKQLRMKKNDIVVSYLNN